MGPDQVDDASPTNEFAELYFAAKGAILFYETRERRQALAAITDLRDALDHLMLADIAQSADRREAELVSAKEHLRRAAVEPLEEAVESRLLAAMRRYRWRLLASVLFLPRPDETQVDFLISKTQHALEEGRKCKNAAQWRTALDHCKDGYRYCEELYRLLPDRELYFARLFSLLLVALGAAIGLLLRKLLGS